MDNSATRQYRRKHGAIVSSHTQGPWHYALTVVDNGDEYLTIIGTPNGNEDDLPHRGAFIGKITGKRERREANARLIASAPKLLEALEELRKELRNHIKMDVKKHYSLMVADAAAGTAIAKAKGK